MKGHLKKWVGITVAALMCIMLMTAINPNTAAYAVDADTPCDYLKGSNSSAQNYSTWSSTVESYLAVTDDGYMRVQGGFSGGNVEVEYYNSDFE